MIGIIWQTMVIIQWMICGEWEILNISLAGVAKEDGDLPG